MARCLLVGFPTAIADAGPLTRLRGKRTGGRSRWRVPETLYCELPYITTSAVTVKSAIRRLKELKDQ